MIHVRARFPSIFVVAVLMSLCARRASAEEEREPVRVKYAVTETGCPDEARFVLELTARTSKISVVQSGERRLLRVVIDRHAAPASRVAPARVRGTLTLGAGGKSATREVVGQSCAEVVSALALVAALAIDPHASTKPAPDLAPKAPDPPPKAPDPPPVPPFPPPLPPPDPPPPPLPVVRVVPTPRPPLSRFALSVAARGGARTGPLPTTAPELGGLVEAAWIRPSMLSPSARVELVGTFGQSTRPASTAGAPSASLGWTGVRVSGCPLRVVRGMLTLSSCGVVDGGLLTAHADGLANAQKDSRVSVALGAGFAGRWTLAGRFFVGADVGLSAPLVRQRFYAAGTGSTPGVTLYELPSLQAFGGLFLGFDLFS